MLQVASITSLPVPDMPPEGSGRKAAERSAASDPTDVDGVLGSLSRAFYGQLSLVGYEDGHIWHERLLLFPTYLSCSNFIIMTLDNDLYEGLMVGGDEIVEVKVHHDNGVRPHADEQVCSF